jgi:hypothetical protein
MRRDFWLRNGEIVLLLPATVVMAPLGAFASLGMVFAIVQQKFGFNAFLMMFMVLAAFVAGILGLVSVWASLVISSQRFAQNPIVRIVVASGIVVGISDAIYWLINLRHELNSLGPSAWSIWLVMLVGPMVVGVHQLLRLIWLRQPAGIVVEKSPYH